MNPVIMFMRVLVYIGQSAVSAWYFSHYFEWGGRAFQVYFWPLLVYAFLLQLLPLNYYLLINIMTLMLIYIISRCLYTDRSWKQIVWGMVWFWLPMPLTEMAMVGMIRIAFGYVPAWLSDNESVFFCDMQLVMTILLICEYMLIVWISRRRRVSNSSMIPLLPVVASVCILAYLCLCRLSVIEQRWFFQLFVACVVVLIILNVIFVRWLQRYVKKQTQLKARQLIQEEYNRQFEQLKQSDVTRARLRQFRHDLVNVLEKETNI